MAFYKEHVPVTCEKCGKRPRELYRIKTSGSSPSWGQFCTTCADRRIKELTASWGSEQPR
jgi:hypothetical protein